MNVRVLIVYCIFRSHSVNASYLGSQLGLEPAVIYSFVYRFGRARRH